MYNDILRLWRIFHGIGEQVDEYLPKTVFISQDTAACSALYQYLMCRCGRLHVFYRFQHQRVQFKWLDVEGQLPGLHPGNIEQVADKFGEPVELGIHASDVVK